MANCVWTSKPRLTPAPPSSDSVSVSSRRLLRLCNLSFARTLRPSPVRNSSSSRRTGVYCSSDGGGGQNQTEATGIQLYRDIERLSLILSWFWFNRPFKYSVRSIICFLLTVGGCEGEIIWQRENVVRDCGVEKWIIWEDEVDNVEKEYNNRTRILWIFFHNFYRDILSWHNRTN